MATASGPLSSGTSASAVSRLVKHGQIETTGYSGQYDTFCCSGHCGGYDYLRSPDDPDLTLGGGGLLVAPIENEHPASDVTHRASNNAVWKNCRRQVVSMQKWVVSNGSQNLCES